MDVLNFISWLKSKRQVTTVDASQTLIPVGLKDARRKDGYLPGAISVEDFASAVAPSLYDNQDNTFIGKNVFNTIDNVDKISNIAIGTRSLEKTIAGYNVGIGPETLNRNTTGFSNVAIGNNALYFNTIGHDNIGLGQGSLLYNTTGINNIALGTLTMMYNTSGSDNIVIGISAAQSNSVGSYNTIIGTGANNGNFSSCIILGKEATATASNQFVVGSTSNNAGAIATEALTLTKSWTVRINGVNYKIPLQVA